MEEEEREGGGEKWEVNRREEEGRKEGRGKGVEKIERNGMT